MGFTEEARFVCAGAVTAALDGIDSVEGLCRVVGVFVISETQLNACGLGTGLVQEATLLKLPRDERDAVESAEGRRQAMLLNVAPRPQPTSREAGISRASFCGIWGGSGLYRCRC